MGILWAHTGAIGCIELMFPPNIVCLSSPSLRPALITDLNYFLCQKVVELLKSTEGESKNLFGQYNSLILRVCTYIFCHCLGKIPAAYLGGSRTKLTTLVKMMFKKGYKYPLN